jgi:pimeloyl-ACP methyl ester carboxylesterase
MKRMIISGLRVLIWVMAAIFLYFVFEKIGRDAQRTQRQHERIRILAGPSQVHQLYRLRHRMLQDTIEERVRFSARLSHETLDRIERQGILVRRKQSPVVILICHGFTCSKDDVRFLRGSLFSDYTTMSFDFRAHGECCTSEHVATFGAQEKYDVIGAVEFIRSQPDLAHKPLIVFGFSMGAVAAILAQAERKDLFAGAILDCPFESTDKLIERLINTLNFSIAGYEFGLPGKSLLKRYAYNPYVQEVIRKALSMRTSPSDSSRSNIKTLMVPIDTVQAAQSLSIPTLFIVCKKDKKAPVSAVYDVYRVSPGFKRLWITNGRDHFDSFFHNPERYGYMIFNFIETILEGRLCRLCKEEVVIDGPDQSFWEQELMRYSGGAL